MAAKTKSKKKNFKVSPEERAYKRDIRRIFRNCGFSRYAQEKELEFEGSTSDFDDLFVYDNVFVFVEYTMSKVDKVGDHLKPKVLLYQKIAKKKAAFLEFIAEKFPAVEIPEQYTANQCAVVVLYCARNNVQSQHKALAKEVIYLDYHVLRYFLSISNILRHSARFELFNFLGLSHEMVGQNAIAAHTLSQNSYPGSILPESHSSFAKGFKVVSFYVDPEALLSRSYVLRKDGWNDDNFVYQRMISQKKVAKIRQYLNEQKRVFVNNIIITLPDAARLVNEKSKTIDPEEIVKTMPVTIQIPADFNSIGIIDGQHRVFSYHEGGKFDDKIKFLRKKQNLLATGIVFPEKFSQTERTKFEAKLFLEINSTQTSAPSELKHAISLLLTPFAEISIAKRVVDLMNSGGPLAGQFEAYFFDKHKIKTTSIVSYGVRNVVKFSGKDSLFGGWGTAAKRKGILDATDPEALKEYIKYCGGQINIFIGAVKKNIPESKWSLDKKVSGRVLTTTAINGFVVCLRQILEKQGAVKDFAYYDAHLKKVGAFKFGAYKSSQYGKMGHALYEAFFA